MTASALSEIPKDWTIIPANKVYYDSSKDQYVSTILLNEEVVSEETKNAVFSTYYSLFLDNILAALAKETADGTWPSAITYGKYRADLIKKIEVIQDFISPFPNIKQRILLGIPKGQIDKLSGAPIPDLEDSLNSSYSLNLFYDKIDLVAKKFQEFQVDYIKDISKMKNSGYKGLDFILESENLYAFSSNLNDLITSNDIDSSIYENIEFYFSNAYEIIYISLFGNLKRTTLEVSFSDFVKTNPQNRPETNYFIYYLDELCESCKSASVSYQDIIKTRFLNTPSKNSTSNSNLIKRSDKNSPSYGISNKSAAKGSTAFKEISKRSAKIFQNAVLDSIYEKPCMTPEAKLQKDKLLKQSAQEKLTFAGEISNQIGDAFLDGLPDILQKVTKQQGQKALQALGKDVLNRLGVCGLGDLISLVANTAMSYLNADEYSEEISKCALENLDNDKLYALSRKLVRLGKSAEILEKYRQIVGDTILPWDAAGYSPPDYHKNLKTDDPIYERYTLKAQSPTTSVDINIRFRAYKESIGLSISAPDLLDSLLDTFPDEMGWIGFFTDLTTGVLEKCGVGHAGTIKTNINVNLCKRVSMPKLPDITRGGSSVFSSVATIVVEEIKNIVIGLIVKLITSTMSQLFQIISAGVSGDTDYFKRGGAIPDLFQSDNFMHNAFYENADNKKQKSDDVNACVRQVIYDTKESVNITEKLSLEEINSFLKIISVSLGEYEKIKLFKGEAGNTTYDKVTQLIKGTTLALYLKTYSDVEQIFLEIGKLLNVSKMESDYFNNLYDASLPIEFCIIETDMLERAYLKNKPDITEEQIARMEETLKDIQKDKLCFSANAIGNTSAPIFGQAMETIMDPDGPVYGKVKEQQAEFFTDGMDIQFKLFFKNYNSELYKNEGFFDIILGKQPQTAPYIPFSGYNNSKFLSMLGVSLPVEGERATVLKDFEERTQTNLDSEIFNILPKAERDEGVNKISELLEESLSPIASLREKIKTNFVRSDVLWIHTTKYKNRIKEKIVRPDPSTPITALQKDYWTNLNNLLNSTSDILMGSAELKTQIKDLYKKANLNLEGSPYVPFNVLTTAEELAVNYGGAILLINTIISEIILRSTSIFIGCDEGTFVTRKKLTEFIESKILSILEDNNRISTFFYEIICQIYLKLIETGIIENTDENVEKIVENFNQIIKNWVSGIKGSRTTLLNENKGDVEYISKLFIRSTISAYFDNVNYEYIKTLIQIGTPYNLKTLSLSATLNSGEVKEVWGDVDVGITPPEIPYLRVEKYINVGNSNAESIPSGIQRLDDLNSFLSIPRGGKISEMWPDGWKYGIRISSVYPFSMSGAKESDFDPIDHADINLERYKNKAFLLKGSEAGLTFLLPIISFEEAIPDQPINTSIINSYNDSEMTTKLINSEKFIDFYYAGMNIENLLTFITIYNYELLGNVPNLNWSGEFFESSQKFAMSLIKES